MRKFVVPLLVLTFALSGCSKAPREQPEPENDTAKVLAYTKCMRENGVDMEDPPPGGMAVPGIPAMDAGSPEMKKVEAAAEKCAELLPADTAEGRKITPEDLEKARALSRCMRENGLPDFPDPDPESGAVKLDPDVEFDVRKVDEAGKKCGGTLPLQAR